MSTTLSPLEETVRSSGSTRYSYLDAISVQSTPTLYTSPIPHTTTGFCTVVSVGTSMHPGRELPSQVLALRVRQTFPLRERCRERWQRQGMIPAWRFGHNAGVWQVTWPSLLVALRL